MKTANRSDQTPGRPATIDELMTGEEYLESLRDGREVYLYGERVDDEGLVWVHGIEQARDLGDHLIEVSCCVVRAVARVEKVHILIVFSAALAVEQIWPWKLN